MEDDELCFGVRPWCQREDYRSAFGISLSEPLFTITDTLQQSVLSTLKFPEVVAKSVSVDGPVRVDNIDQHVRIRSEIIIPTQSIIASPEDPLLPPNCPQSGRKPCRDPVSPAGGDGANDDECDDDEEEDEEENEEDEEDEEECDEDEEEQDDEGYKDALEFLDECEDDDDDDEDTSMQQCSHKGPGRDAPASKRIPQAPSKYPTEIPVKQRKEKETEQKVCSEPKSKTDTDAKKAEDDKKVEGEAQKELTPEEEKELTDLHEECLYLSKEELEAICTKYKSYDKKWRVKRAKSGQTGVCKFRTNNKQQKDTGTVGQKQQEEATNEEDNEYFCEETGSENAVVVDAEDDDECDDEEKKEKEESEMNEKDADDAEDEDYEDEDEIEPYYGADRPCRAAPNVCERSNQEKPMESNKECTPRDYSRYDQKRYEEKENDIFFKLSPKFADDAKGSKENKQRRSDVACDDGNKHRSKHRGLPKGEQSAEIFNNKLAQKENTLYYCDNTTQEITSNKRNKKAAKEDKPASDIKQSTTEDYFACKRNEQQTSAKSQREQKELCSQEYYTPNGNNNNNSDDNEEDGGYFESSEGLVKDDDGDDRCDYASSSGGFAYKNSHVDEVEDNKNESCGAAAAVGEHTRYHDIQSTPQNGGMADKMEPVGNYSCPENTRKQQKYQAYGHSGGDDDVDDRYFTSTVLPSGEDARRNKTTGVNCPVFTPAEPNYFTSGAAGPTCLAFSVGGLAMSPFEPLSADVVSMTGDHFERCKRVFESMKQRAFGDDFEDYFESCVSSSLGDNLDTNLPSADTTPPVDQLETAPMLERKRPASIDEECEAKRNGFLKSLFGIINKSGIKQNRKNGKVSPDGGTATGDGCQPVKIKAVEKKFFTFGRYKEKNGEKAGNKNGCVVKKIKENSGGLAGKSEKRKFRFGKTSSQKGQKKVDTVGMIENFLAIEKTANQYYAIDDDFEIKNNGYIFKCGKVMKRLHTGDPTELVNERRGPDGERQHSGDMERSSATNEAVSAKAFQATPAAGDCDQSQVRNWSQAANLPPEPADIKKTSHPEMHDVSRGEELIGDLELTAPHKLANDVAPRSSQTELLEKLPSVGNIRDATLMHSVSEISEKVDLTSDTGGTRKAYSAPDSNSACVQTIVSDDMSSVDALKTSLCGFPMTPSESKGTKQGQPKRKVSSFLVVSKTTDKRPHSRVRPFHKVIRRKITEQEAIIISRHDKKFKEGKSPGKSQNDQEMRPQTTVGYRSKEKTSAFNYGKHIHESKSLNRTVFQDSNTTRHVHPSEFKLGPHENSTTSLLAEKIYNWPLRIHEQKAREKYPDTISSRRNKSADGLTNIGCGIHSIEARHINEDDFGNLQSGVSPYIARTSMFSARAKSDTRLQKQTSDKGSDSWLGCELPDCETDVKSSLRQKQFVNRSVLGDRKIPRETFGHRKTKRLLSKVIYDENHNVNCGADDDDDDDMDNCQPQTVNNIIFSDKQQPIQHVRNKIEVMTMEENQPIPSRDEIGSNSVLDSFVLNETAQTNVCYDEVSCEYIQAEIPVSGYDNSTRWNNPQIEIAAESNTNEQMQQQIPTTEESKVNTEIDTRGNEQFNTEAGHFEGNITSSETVNKEAPNFLLSVGDNTNGNIVESFLSRGEAGQQQKLYNGELGMVQDCSGSHWEIEPSVHEDYLIVNSKNENVIYHFQSENRPIWKLGDYDDIEGPLHEAQDENVNQGRYTKYDSVDDGRDGAIFDENQLMRCAQVRTTAADNGRRQRSKEHGLFSDKRSRGPGDYDTGARYGDRSAERKHSFGSSAEPTKYGYTRTSSSQRKDQGAWDPSEGYETNKPADAAGPYCNSCVGKAWRFTDTFFKNVGDEVKDSDGCVDGTYTSEWNDGGKWQTATAHPENRREDGKEREFWGEYIYSTVGNYGKTRAPTAVNIDASMEGRKDPEFWNNPAYTAVNSVDKASVIADGSRGEAKDNDFWATALYSLAKNTNEQPKKKGEELNEHVGDEFWSDRLYSPTRKGKVNWKASEMKTDELNTVLDSHINTDENMTKAIPVRDERKIHVPPEKESAGASKISNREADMRAERDRKSSRQGPAPTLPTKPFLHLPEQYAMQTHKNKPRNDPVQVVPSKDIPAENKGKPISMPETCKEPPCLKDKPVNIYEISKPTVIKLKPNNTVDTVKATAGKEKRNNVHETVKEKPSNANETAKSTWSRRKEQNIYETNNAAMREEKQKANKAVSKDVKKSESNRKTRHTSSSETAKIMAEAKVEQKSHGKELVSRKEKIGDWFGQEKVSTSPDARRSTKRDNEENPSREPRFASGGKHQPYLLKPEVRVPGVHKEEGEARAARDKAHENVLNQKPPVKSLSQENATGDQVIYVNPCGDGTRNKKWKLYIISERKPCEGNRKQDAEPQPATHHQVSKSRESKDRVQIGAVNTTTRQLAVKLNERPAAVRVEDELSMRHANGQRGANLKTAATASQHTKQQPEARKAKRAVKDDNALVERKDITNVSDKKSHDSKSTKESAEQHKKQARVYKLDIDEHFKVYDHKTPAAGIKPPVNAIEEYGLGQLLQLTAHSRDKDTERFNVMLGNHEDQQHKPTKARVFKIDCEERIGDKSRHRKKDTTARKQKAADMDIESYLLEPPKRPARVIDKEEKDRANKAFFDRYRHRQRHQKSETTVTEEHKTQVENSKSEVLSCQQSTDDNKLAFNEDIRKANSSRKEERKKWKEEIHRTRYRSESKNTNNMNRTVTHKSLEENCDMETPNTYSYQGYMSNSGQGEGFKYGEGESHHKQETAGESCVDVVPARQDILSTLDIPRIECDQRSKASSSKHDSDTKKFVYRQSKENRRRHDAVKKSRTDTNQTDRFVPTLIDSSVVNTVARAWMDDTERLGINSLQEAKLFSPSVLLQQTSGSLSANCHYMNTPREMNNTPELTNQHNSLTIGGDYFDFFPRPTFLPVRRYQNFDSGEHTHKASTSSSDNEYASGKLCPKGYFDTYKNDEEVMPHQAGYSGDTPSSQEKEQKEKKNPEPSKRPKPYYHNTEKVSSAAGRIVTRSYFANADKAAEIRRHTSKDDSFINVGHSHNAETSVSKFVDKNHSRQSRLARTPERPHAVSEHPTVKQTAQERKSADPRNIKRAAETSKSIRKIESADNVKAAGETSKAVKTAHDHAKTSEHSHNTKSQTENSQSNAPSSDNIHGKGHMFSYKVSSKGNRPEVVKALPRQQTQADIEAPAANPETVAPQVEAARHEPTPEPAQMGLFARLLNTLTRSNNNQAVTPQTRDDGASKVEPTAAAKPEVSVSAPNTAEDPSTAKEKSTSATRNKSLRSRNPLPTRDAKTLRPDYKQNMNCNAAVRPGMLNAPSVDSFALMSKPPVRKPKSGHSMKAALTGGKMCIQSLTTALEWNAILLIVIFALYLGTCCPGLLKRCLYCPLPSVWDILYKYGLISLGVDAFLISKATTKPFAFGIKGPQKGVFYSFAGKHLSAIFGPLVYAAALLYTYLNGPFISALWDAVMKVITYLLFCLIYVCSSILYFLPGPDATHKPPTFGGMNMDGRVSFYPRNYQLKHGCDFAFWESLYLKATNRYPAKCL